MCRHSSITAISASVEAALSERKADFVGKIHEIEGEVNRKGGGRASLTSGIFVSRFADEANKEMRERAQIAKITIENAVSRQAVQVRPGFLKKLRPPLQAVWAEGIEDITSWYSQRVSNANAEIAEQKPLDAHTAFQRIFVDLQNKALAPGFWGRNKDRILVAVISLLAGAALARLTDFLEFIQSLFFRESQ